MTWTPGRRRRLHVGLAASTALLLAAALPACSRDDGDVLTIYSGRTEELIGPLLERFNDETGQRVEVRYGDSGELALLIEEEGDKSPADVFLSQSPGAMDYLSGQGRLTALPAELLDQVHAGYRSSEGLWVGLSGRARVLVYNVDEVAEADLPTSVFDLVEPAYKGKVALAPSNGSFQDFVTAMRQRIGDDETLAWLRGLNDNGARSYANNVAIVQAVGQGEVPMGLVNHYYNERAKAENPDVASENHPFEAGDLGNLVLVTGVGILGSGDADEAAQRFIDYLLEAPAQEYFAEETYEYPLAAGVAPAVELPPLDAVAGPEEDLSSLGDLTVTARLIDESGLASG